VDTNVKQDDIVSSPLSSPLISASQAHPSVSPIHSNDRASTDPIYDQGNTGSPLVLTQPTAISSASSDGAWNRPNAYTLDTFPKWARKENETEITVESICIAAFKAGIDAMNACAAGVHVPYPNGSQLDAVAKIVGKKMHLNKLGDISFDGPSIKPTKIAAMVKSFFYEDRIKASDARVKAMREHVTISDATGVLADKKAQTLTTVFVSGYVYSVLDNSNLIGKQWPV
jgi:hypothetical protein